MVGKNELANEGVLGEEAVDGQFADSRLRARFERLLLQMGERPGSGISVACEDWANTKAAYRFLSNPRVSEDAILSGHFAATKRRVAATQERVLVLHDTTEFSFKREAADSIGLLKKLPKPKTMRDAFGAPHFTTCGILMHSSLLVTLAGIPLGLGAVKFWTRDRFKGTNALKRKVNTTRIPIEQKESMRWLDNLRQVTTLVENPVQCVHIGDRESDIYELFQAAVEAQTFFLVRTCVDRLSGGKERLVSEEITESKSKGLHTISLTDRDGQVRNATLDIKFLTLVIRPPVDKKKRCTPMELTVIDARELAPRENTEPIVWKLLTNLPIKTLADAIEKLGWYAMRWKIETFHKILKSGCRAESSRLRTAERLVNLIAIFCIVSWRIFWMTMLQRAIPSAAPTIAFTEDEIFILTRRRSHSKNVQSLAECTIEVAKLGGYLARSSDPPPGNLVIWRGLARLNDLTCGTLLQKQRRRRAACG